MSEFYVSTDIEANGPIPGPYSMLSFGSAAFTDEGELIDTFSRNLELLPGATQHPETMLWWDGRPEAYAATRTNLVSPEKAMHDYNKWLFYVCPSSKPVFVGFPVAYDFMFVYWYLMNFFGESRFKHSALDIKTMAMIAMKCDYRKAYKGNMPKHWFKEDAKHTHVALEDAIEQGHLFFNIKKDLAI